MNVPSYVQSLLETASYEFDWYKNNPGYAAGYTIAIRKRSDYQTVDTFRKEIERLQKWINRQKGGEMLILSLPQETHHCAQHAYVTIFDPVMQHLEKFIPKPTESIRQLPCIGLPGPTMKIYSTPSTMEKHLVIRNQQKIEKV